LNANTQTHIPLCFAGATAFYAPPLRNSGFRSMRCESGAGKVKTACAVFSNHSGVPPPPPPIRRLCPVPRRPVRPCPARPNGGLSCLVRQYQAPQALCSQDAPRHPPAGTAAPLPAGANPSGNPSASPSCGRAQPARPRGLIPGLRPTAYATRVSPATSRSARGTAEIKTPSSYPRASDLT
jgi:hypothetical protein